ncbi:MAG TPA: PhnD/SsuA/transferrin family substrate-binding protein [Ramlibacter sp.]|nr:PhnD/SsuA/transferrin family substrate-binding protein [Ramlibacter sp.]
MSQLAVNARMYSVTPAVKADWRCLLQWVLAHADLDWQVIDHDAPAPLSSLWARNDIGAAMMCGLPFSQREPRPTLVAAPIPSPPRYDGKPVYFTDIVVRADSPFQAIEETFGGVVGYTLADSLSGGVALATYLQQFRSTQRPRLYRQSVGNLIHARGVIDALAEGIIDVGPLDSYYRDLLQRNDPSFAAKIRTIASTPALPIPPLVATAAISAAELQRLRAALQAAGESNDMTAVMERLLLEGFAFPSPADYSRLAQMPSRIATSFEEL